MQHQTIFCKDQALLCRLHLKSCRERRLGLEPSAFDNNFEIAGVPPTTVNWAGDEQVSVEEWTAYLGELTGLTANLVVSEHSLASGRVNLDRMHELVGHTTVHWKDGMRRMVQALRPDLLKA